MHNSSKLVAPSPFKKHSLLSEFLLDEEGAEMRELPCTGDA